jgi:hypothetical protein
MIKCIISALLQLAVFVAMAQDEKDILFDKNQPLKLAFSISIRTIKDAKFDTVYFPEKLHYGDSTTQEDSLNMAVKRRGNFRLQQCHFPPLWLKIEKKQSKNTVFEGNRKLKLVMPCDSRELSNELIIREYLCYKLYEQITPYAFKSKLVDIEFTEERGKKSKTYQLKGILIEDVSKTAKRFSAQVSQHASVIPKALNDTAALRFDLFQLLIANTDFSKGFQHNSKLIYQNTRYIPLPYDFDMSGVVDAPYAVVSKVGNNELPIESVRERYYRGFCATKEVTDMVRAEYLSKEEVILAVPNQLQGNLSAKQIDGLKSYLKDFFDILRNDNLFQREVLGRCRPK